MDPEVKKEVKTQLKRFLARPMFLWLFAYLCVMWGHTFFEDSEYYTQILIGLGLFSILCMYKFMSGMDKASADNMRYWEKKNMDFIRKSINTGIGKAIYMIPDYNIDGFWKKQKMKWLGVTYVCPYVARFVDTGMETHRAHIRIPVSKRQMFQLKLMGCYETKNRERAVKALEFLGVDWPLP